MAIVVACRCGRRFQADDAWAGRRARCPGCGTELTIPQPAGPRASAPSPSPLEDILEEAKIGEEAGPRCPECHEPIQPGAVLCVACGLDLKTGKKLRTKVVSTEDDDPAFAKLPTHGVEALDRAERELVRQKLQAERLERGAPWWIFLIALLLCVAFVVTAVRLKPNPLMMAGVVVGVLFEFALQALALGGACTIYMGFRRSRGPVSPRDEVTPPSMGYAMGIFVAAIGMTAAALAGLLPLFGIRYWASLPETFEEVPNKVPLGIVTGIVYLASIVVASKFMLPAKWKHAAWCTLVFIGVFGAINGGLLLFYLFVAMMLN